MKIIPLSIPTPFYVGDVNVFLIKSDPLTLIDTGPKTAEALTVLRGKLRRHSVDFADIKRVVLTHAHEDHCGLAKVIRGESGAEIFVHDWETGHLRGRILGEESRILMSRAGVSTEIFGELETIFARIDRLADAFSVNEVSSLRDETELEFAGGVLKILHTPGHTPGSCSFVRESDRTIIAGDTILKRITPNPIIALDPFDKNQRFKSLGEYLVSLAKIKSCAPTLVYGGHGEPITDFDELFNRYIRAIDERQKKVISLINTDGMTAYETTRKLFPDAVDNGVHRFLAISETTAHLDYAVQTRKIEVELKDGAEFYRK